MACAHRARAMTAPRRRPAITTPMAAAIPISGAPRTRSARIASATASTVRGRDSPHGPAAGSGRGCGYPPAGVQAIGVGMGMAKDNPRRRAPPVTFPSPPTGAATADPSAPTTMAYTTLLFELTDGIARITVNRPDKLNALNAAVIAELGDAVGRIERDPAVRGGAPHRRGAPRRSWPAPTSARSPARDRWTGKARALAGQRVFRRLERCGKPVVAAVNGFALGGGCELAMACHIRVAAESARFGQPEVKLGIGPGYGGTVRLPRLVGRGRALELLLTGAMIDAQEALRIGLVNRVVPADRLLPESEQLLRTILANGPLAIRACLEAVDTGLDMGLDEALLLEANLFGLLSATADMREGTRRFWRSARPSLPVPEHRPAGSGPQSRCLPGLHFPPTRLFLSDAQQVVRWARRRPDCRVRRAGPADLPGTRWPGGRTPPVGIHRRPVGGHRPDLGAGVRGQCPSGRRGRRGHGLRGPRGCRPHASALLCRRGARRSILGIPITTSGQHGALVTVQVFGVDVAGQSAAARPPQAHASSSAAPPPGRSRVPESGRPRVRAAPRAAWSLLGANAQGKTNLLEAIYYPVLFRSFRGAPDQEVGALRRARIPRRGGGRGRAAARGGRRDLVAQAGASGSRSMGQEPERLAEAVGHLAGGLVPARRRGPGLRDRRRTAGLPRSAALAGRPPAICAR